MKKTKIKNINAREILDSRGNPTLEVTVKLKDGNVGIAGVPSGASTGSNEAVEIRDGDQRYNGKGVLKACSNVNNQIFKALHGCNVMNQNKLDDILIDLDGTDDKSKLGANAIVGVSIACAKAAAQSYKIELYEYIEKIFGQANDDFPTPMFNVFNGGKHVQNKVDIQEFMIIPNTKIETEEQVRIGSEIFHSLKGVLLEKKLNVGVGDEGGYASTVKTHDQIFEYMLEAGEKAGYEVGSQFQLAIDAAASSFFDPDDQKYIFALEDKEFSPDELVKIYQKWVKKYYLFSIEDGLDEHDFNGWSKMKDILSDTQIVADDLTVTNTAFLAKAINKGCANAVIIKPNQIGTVTEAIKCAQKAKNAGWKTIVSHRSGETCDDFITDLAVGIGADFLKAGAPSRGERVAKYNRLLKIAQS
ncbi:phosphopyruvate hydratase [bacterium]|nr:MAG: phosphopyruvate hydratase [bacterium]